MVAGRGINLGNALDTKGDGPWTGWLRPRHIDLVVAAGFDWVRLPVMWSAHADLRPPYGIDPRFLTFVDRWIDRTLANGLDVVIDMHHYDELSEATDTHADRFLALWDQIAAHYADRPGRLHFELLNEPHDPMTADGWNDLVVAALEVVRPTNPDRTVIVGPLQANAVEALPQLILPPDPHLAAGVHYYAPFRFTHQGAPWIPAADQWTGTTWGAEDEHDRVRHDLAAAATWASDHGIPLVVGEFGTYQAGEMGARARWTRCVREQAEQLGLAWAYWDLGTDFGAYDVHRDTWNEPLLQALCPPATH